MKLKKSFLVGLLVALGLVAAGSVYVAQNDRAMVAVSSLYASLTGAENYSTMPAGQVRRIHFHDIPVVEGIEWEADNEAAWEYIYKYLEEEYYVTKADLNNGDFEIDTFRLQRGGEYLDFAIYFESDDESTLLTP